MKKSIIKILTIGFVSALALATVGACGESRTIPVTLEEPTNLCADFWELTWDSVEDASGYVVRIDEKEYQTQETYFDLYEFVEPGGDLIIDVKAKGDGENYGDSAWSNVNYEAEPVTENLVYDDLLVAFEISYNFVQNLPESGEVVFPSVYQGQTIKQIINSLGGPLFDHSKIKKIRLPAFLEDIDYGVFYQSSISEIRFPKTLIGISAYAFYDCDNLTSVHFPKSLTIIDQEAFADCRLLSDVTYDEGIRLTMTGTEFEGTKWWRNQEGGWVTCANVLYGYKGILPTGEKITIPHFSSLTSIATYIYGARGVDPNETGDAQLKEVTIEEGYEDVSAFQACENLEKVNLPDGVKSIKFTRCISLKEINLPESLKQISDFAFQECTSLTELVLPSGVETIGYEAFSESGITRIKLSSSLKSIGQCAFLNTPLESIEIPSNVESIANKAFARCSNLKKLTFCDNQVLDLEEDVFFGCPIESLDLPDAIKLIEGSLGSYLKYLVIPTGIRKIVYDQLRHSRELRAFYYRGTQAQWSQVIIDREERSDVLFNPLPTMEEWEENLTVYFYSESEPTEEGNFWRYVDGVPTVWT